MVALDPDLLLGDEFPAPPQPSTFGSYEACTHLADADRDLLERVAGHLPLLADLTHADAVLFARSGDQVVVVAQAQPVPVPSPYALPLAVGRTMTREEAPLVFRLLFDGRTRTQVTSTVIRGAPVLQEVFPIRNEYGAVVGALRSEMLLIEHERQRPRHVPQRHRPCPRAGRRGQAQRWRGAGAVRCPRWRDGHRCPGPDRILVRACRAPVPPPGLCRQPGQDAAAGARDQRVHLLQGDGARRVPRAASTGARPGVDQTRRAAAVGRRG